MFFDNLTRAQLLAMPTAESDHHGEGENLRPAFRCCPKAAARALSEHDNPNV
jgi:hypothetical protein